MRSPEGAKCILGRLGACSGGQETIFYQGTRSMNIAQLTPLENWNISVVAQDGRKGPFDVRPYLHFEAFEELQDITEFMKIKNGGYFVEWACGADLSADTIEAKMVMVEEGWL